MRFRARAQVSVLRSSFALFNSGLEGQALQVEVDTQYPDFKCEECSVSPHSPGPVITDELLIFLTIHPIHYDHETGLLSPIAFEQLTRNDLSVLRQSYSTLEQIEAVRNRLLELGAGKIERSISWCSVAATRKIREHSDETGRTMGVYDRALEHLSAHASVFVRKDFLHNRSSRQEVRLIAHSIFSVGVTPLEHVIDVLMSSVDSAADH